MKRSRANTHKTRTTCNSVRATPPRQDTHDGAERHCARRPPRQDAHSEAKEEGKQRGDYCNEPACFKPRGRELPHPGKLAAAPGDRPNNMNLREIIWK